MNAFLGLMLAVAPALNGLVAASEGVESHSRSKQSNRRITFVASDSGLLLSPKSPVHGELLI
jgi:hypothetical protein